MGQFEGDIMETLECTPSIIKGDSNGKSTTDLAVEQKQDEHNEWRIIGHGISRKLYDQCCVDKKRMVVMCQYTEDGDNTEESVVYLQKVAKLVDSLNDCDVR